jgi:alkylation response protein AidB-like acyl-CoA dehydrogenase
MQADWITTPDDPRLNALSRTLAHGASRPGAERQWPAEALRQLADAGVFAWFVPAAFGGLGWSSASLVRGYLALAAADLTTTFILTQWVAACRRIAECDNAGLQTRLLPAMARGEHLATVGISHLSTSRRHLARPALAARPEGDGFVLDGFTAWVTGGIHADTLVLGGVLDDGRQVLAAVPRRASGLEALPPVELVALSGSHTGEVRCHSVRVSPGDVIAGPVENVMAGDTGPSTGGWQTSALALGVAAAAIDLVRAESQRRPELVAPSAALADEQTALVQHLLRLAGDREGEAPAEAAALSANDLRHRANSLALRATQAALLSVKGAGYVAGHPAGRWCREALFFLVWSCPPPVVQVQLQELATRAAT